MLLQRVPQGQRLSKVCVQGSPEARMLSEAEKMIRVCRQGDPQMTIQLVGKEREGTRRPAN